MKTNRKAFTLIELLIVIAIIAIGASALLAVIVAPLKEQVIADYHVEMERGSMSFFSSLTTDIHSAGDFEIGDNGSRIEITPAIQNENRIIYYVNDEHVLRRWKGPVAEAPESDSDAPVIGAPLVSGIEILNFSQPDTDSNSLSIRLHAKQQVMQHPVAVKKDLTISVGGDWKGAP